MSCESFSSNAFVCGCCLVDMGHYMVSWELLHLLVSTQVNEPLRIINTSLRLFVLSLLLYSSIAVDELLSLMFQHSIIVKVDAQHFLVHICHIYWSSVRWLDITRISPGTSPP